MKRPIAHGHLNSHNVFVTLSEREQKAEDQTAVLGLNVQIGDLEGHNLKKFANIRHNYRQVTVWSPPENLKFPKKVLDPTPEMDVYSFGLLMWELLHEQVPFGGDIKATIKLVVQDNVRPKIVTDDERSSSEEDSGDE